MKDSITIKCEDLSNFRQSLMGIGILGVLIAHWFGFQHINDGTFYLLSSYFCRLVFTEGFLFLSGFGLYCSYRKNENARGFYSRRIKRLIIPFLILSMPVYLFRYYLDASYSFYDFLTQITTVYFWIKGNFYGMWYISLSVLLYIVFPLFYKFLFISSKHIFLRFLALLFLLMSFNYVLQKFSANYYNLLEIGISKIPIFMFGIYAGYLCSNKIISDKKYLQVFFSMALLYIILSLFKQNYWIMNLCGQFQKLVFIPLICATLRLTSSSTIGTGVMYVLNFFGKYSLELYIVHLHTYLVFSIMNLNLSNVLISSLSITISVILCVPLNMLIKKIVNYSYYKDCGKSK